MPLQNFVDNSLPTIKAAWLNAVDAFYFTLFNSATTAAQARTALGSTATGDALFTAVDAAAGRTALAAAASGANTDITSLASPALADATADTQTPGDNSTKVATTAYADASATAAAAAAVAAYTPALSRITASLGADVALNNTANYFDGPSVAQGSTGTWLATGTVTLEDTGGASVFFAKLWDGTTVIASASIQSGAAGANTQISLSGYLATPAGNLRISVRDTTNTTGKILFNETGNSKDSTITAIRIA